MPWVKYVLTHRMNIMYTQVIENKEDYEKKGMIHTSIRGEVEYRVSQNNSSKCKKKNVSRYFLTITELIQ